MNLEAILSDNAQARHTALAASATAPEHERSAFAAKLATAARDAAAVLEMSEGDTRLELRFARACVALSILRLEVAKSALLRIADEGTKPVKDALARSLRESHTPEGRAVLVYLLSDDDARTEALLAIGVAPWPGVLPALIEVAEGDEQAACTAVLPIAKCGATAGPKEKNAAADFLLEQLDDEAVAVPAAVALLRFGWGFPGIAARARRLAKEAGQRKICGLCLLAAFADGGESDELGRLAGDGTRVDPMLARSILEPLLGDEDERVRNAAARTARALGSPLGQYDPAKG